MKKKMKKKWKKKWMLYVCLAFSALLLWQVPQLYAAQPVLLQRGGMSWSKERQVEVLVDSTVLGLDFEQARQGVFLPYAALGDAPLNPRHRYWAKYRFKCTEAGDYYFYFGKGEHISVWVDKGGGQVERKEIGEFVPRSQADVKSRSKSARISFQEGETATVYACIFNETHYPPRVSLSVSDAEAYQKEQMFERLGLQALFHGAIWMMIIYNLLLWWVVDDRAYLAYALYMLALSLTFFLEDQIHYQVFTQLAEYPRVMHFVEMATAQLSIILFFVFMQRMVGTQKLVPFWHSLGKWWIAAKAITLPALIYFNTYEVPDNIILYVLLFVDFLLLFITCMALLFKKDKVAIYFAIGAMILAVCGVLSILNWNGILEFAYLGQMVQFGIIAQIIVFSMGLGYKSRRNASLVVDLQRQNEGLVDELKAKVDEQEKTLRLFMRYVPEPVVASALNKKSNETLFDGEQRYVTALFCDVRGFTGISEELAPSSVVAFLNDFYSVMTVVIKKYGGSVNQFIGDEIFAVFGAPLSTSNNEQRAVLAALEMVDKIQYLNEKYLPEFRQPIRVGIGLNAGQVVAGNLGSEEKMGYSVIGDAVNTAKRIEGLTKSIPNSIVISENVYHKVAPLVRVEEMEDASLKGKKLRIRTYRVLGKR